MVARVRPDSLLRPVLRLIALTVLGVATPLVGLGSEEERVAWQNVSIRSDNRQSVGTVSVDAAVNGSAYVCSIIRAFDWEGTR